MNNSDRMRGVLELIGSGAVLVGLVFVGLELRQNTAAVEAASLQDQTDSSTEFLMLMASDPELTRIFIDGSIDPNELDEVDSRRHFFLVRVRWLRMQNAYRQWRRGTLSEEDWRLYEGLMCRPETTAGISFESTWNEQRNGLLDEFVRFVEDCWSRSR